jgi:hypothetical protein
VPSFLLSVNLCDSGVKLNLAVLPRFSYELLELNMIPRSYD